MKKIQIAIINLFAIMLVIAMISTLASVVAKTEETHGVITISFDDGTQSQFDYAYPLMKARGIVGTFYAITDSISDFSGDNTYMSISELQTLQANGNEIGSHSKTHPHFSQLTDPQIQEECNISKSILQSYGLSATNFCYPYGSSEDRNDHTDTIVSQYYRSGRSTSFSISPITLPVTTWLIVGTAGDNEQPDTLSLLKNFVDQIYASDKWGVIYFHNITPSTTTDTYSTSQQDFQSFLDYIISKGVPTMTVNQVLDLSTPPTTPISASINPTSAKMEIGQSQKFTSTITGGTQPYSYQWYLNGIAVEGANSNTWTFTPTATGHYNAYLNVIDSLNQQDQSNIVNDITVYAQPSVSISPTSAKMEIGQSQTFTSKITGDTSPYSYKWYCNNKEITDATDPTWVFTPTQSGHYSIYLKVTDNLDNQVQSNIVTDSTVYSQTSVTISIMSIRMHVGESRTFTSIVTGELQPYSFQWYCNNTAVTDATESTWTFTPNQTGQFDIYLKVTDSLDYQAQSNTITDVTVYNQPSVSIYSTSTIIEIGQSQVFTSTITGDTSPYAYQWYCNNIAVPDATNSTWTFKPTQTGQYNISLKVTDNLDYQVQSNIVTDITVYPQLTVTISPASVYLTVQQSQTFTLKVTGGIEPYTYQWYQNDTAISGANSNTLTLNPTTAGKYVIYLEVTDNSTTIIQTNKVTIEATQPVENLAIQSEGNLIFSENWELLMVASLLVIFTFTVYVIHRKYHFRWRS